MKKSVRRIFITVITLLLVSFLICGCELNIRIYSGSEAAQAVGADVTEDGSENDGPIIEWIGNNNFSYLENSGIFRLANVVKYSYSGNGDTVPLEYALVLPDDYEAGRTYPVVLYLNDHTSRGTDNSSQLLELLNDMYLYSREYLSEAIIVCPQAVGFWSFSGNEYYLENFQYYSKGNLATAMSLLDSVIGQYGCDTSRQYIMGLGFGANGVWKVLEQYPERFAAAVVMDGTGDTSIATKLADMPIFIYSDTSNIDTGTDNSTHMYRALSNAGAADNLVYRPLSELGVTSYTEVCSDTEMVKWMLEQRRSK